MAEHFSRMHCISNLGGSHWEVMLWTDIGEKYAHFDWKLVSVALLGFGLAFPTFSLAFWKSFFLSCFLFALDPIVVQGGCRLGRGLCASMNSADRIGAMGSTKVDMFGVDRIEEAHSSM